jgi:hypothetical protein
MLREQIEQQAKSTSLRPQAEKPCQPAGSRDQKTNRTQLDLETLLAINAQRTGPLLSLPRRSDSLVEASSAFRHC